MRLPHAANAKYASAADSEGKQKRIRLVVRIVGHLAPSTAVLSGSKFAPAGYP